jgi:outer membrane protein OmpA-like peptidoglycan-associated protein
LLRTAAVEAGAIVGVRGRAAHWTLPAVATGASVDLRTIYFDSGKSKPDKRSKATLLELAAFLTENPTVRIELGGHTDGDGDAAANLTLSDARARAVLKFLTSKKIPVARLVSRGYGESRPVAEEKTDVGKALNRRVEVRVVP